MGSRILVVDDDPDTLKLIDLTLRTAGNQVRLASGGEECLALMRKESFDLVLLDIMMPDISGFDVVRTMHGESESLPPIVFLTARDRLEDQEVGLGLGAQRYLVKPISRGKLLDVIQEVIGT
jgi:two-component system OmpR family response regulator